MESSGQRKLSAVPSFLPEEDARLLDAAREGFPTGQVIELRARKPSPHFDRLLFYVETSPQLRGLVRRLVIVSAPYAQNGFYPEMLPQQAAVSAAMADAMKETPMYKAYVAVAPRPQDFPRLLDRMGELMRAPYDWSEDVKKLKGPVLLVYGDADMIRPEHIVSFYQLLGGGLKDAGWQREHIDRFRRERMKVAQGKPHQFALAPHRQVTGRGMCAARRQGP